MDRRSFLRLAALAALTPGAVVDVLETPRPSTRKRLLQLNAYTLDAETPLDLLTTYLTPNELFFIRSHFIASRVDPAAWTLSVDGEVSRPMRLTLAELRSLPRVDATCVLQCAGNGRALFTPSMPGVQWRHGAVGNARWTGARVKDVLERAGLKPSARHLRTFGSDTPPRQVPPFHRSLAIDKVLEDAIIAYEMNGEPLSHDHGAPARLVVPGWAGEHWMKWLQRISPSRSAQAGFYMDTAYRFPHRLGVHGRTFTPDEMQSITELVVKSTMTTAPARARVGTPVTLRGFALSAAPDIAAVEITDDGGFTWRPADLDRQHHPYAWRLWSCRWTPRSEGVHHVAVRATDSRGSSQPKEALWNPSGYLHNGWHSIRIEATS
jgi:sulfite oxidase